MEPGLRGWLGDAGSSWEDQQATNSSDIFFNSIAFSISCPVIKVEDRNTVGRSAVLQFKKKCQKVIFLLFNYGSNSKTALPNQWIRDIHESPSNPSGIRSSHNNYRPAWNGHLLFKWGSPCHENGKENRSPQGRWRPPSSHGQFQSSVIPLSNCSSTPRGKKVPQTGGKIVLKMRTFVANIVVSQQDYSVELIFCLFYVAKLRLIYSTILLIVRKKHKDVRKCVLECLRNTENANVYYLFCHIHYMLSVFHVLILK